MTVDYHVTNSKIKQSAARTTGKIKRFLKINELSVQKKSLKMLIFPSFYFVLVFIDKRAGAVAHLEQSVDVNPHKTA